MRAAILNGIPHTLNAGPGSARDVEEIPGGTVTTLPPIPSSDGFSIEDAKKWWETGKAIVDAGGDAGTDFNFDSALASAAAGAAAGSAIPGLGTVAGAIIAVGVYVVKWITGRANQSQWDNAGPGVHWWFTNYAPQAYLDYLHANNATGVFASVADSAKGLIVYWLTIDNYVLWPEHKYYANRFDLDYVWDATGLEGEQKMAWLRKLYDDLGVDWDATIDLWNAQGRTSTLMMKKRVVMLDSADELGPDQSTPSEANGTGVAVAVGFGLLALAATSKAFKNSSHG